MRSRGRVIVGVSGSLRNRAALHAAASATFDSGRTLVAITAWLPPGGDRASRQYPYRPLDQAGRTAARTLLLDSLVTLPRGINIEAHAVRGQPGPALVEAAVAADDLLVVGTGRHGMLRLVHGAVTRFCVAHAACPVLAVPEPGLIRDLDRIRRQRYVTVPDDILGVTRPPTRGGLDH